MVRYFIELAYNGSRYHGWQIQPGASSVQEEINRDIDRLVDLKREIMSVIKAVDDAEYQILLEKRYLCFQTWEQIAAEMNYGVRYVHCMHGKALLAVEALMKQVCCK